MNQKPICGYCGEPEDWHGAGSDHKFDAVGGSLTAMDVAAMRARITAARHEKPPFKVRVLGILLLGATSWLMIKELLGV